MQFSLFISPHACSHVLRIVVAKYDFVIMLQYKCIHVHLRIDQSTYIYIAHVAYFVHLSLKKDREQAHDTNVALNL